MKRLFSEHEVGLLADETPEDFARKIICLTENPELCQKLGTNARRLAETELSWERVTDWLEACYRETLARFG